MISKTNTSPSPWALKVLQLFCPEHLLEEIEGDLTQEYLRDVRSLGPQKAKMKFIWNAIRFFRPGIILRKSPLNESTWQNFLHRMKSLGPYKDIKFRQANNFIGWSVFFIALLTYSLTVEETASYWDCGEFIAAAFKLQVPHPPGAPLFLLMGRIFSFLAGGDVTKVALAINMISVLASAFTILFLYWSIVLIGRKMMGSLKSQKETGETTWLLMASGTVGALAYTFSDSFWFSAVEAEVYALSSFFIAFVVWAVLKWDVIDEKGRANRWLLLVAYMIGLSIGVHLLNLLVLPTLAFIFYFKKFEISTGGIIATLAVSIFLVFLIGDFLVPGIPTIAASFELFFVNTLGFFFGSGAFTFFLLLVGVLVCATYYTQKKNYALANTSLLAVIFVLIGYGSYALIVIRSDYDTPINENAPKDVMSFVKYLKREQYGSRPLLYGPYFTESPVGYKLGDVTYIKGKDKYEVSDRKFSYEYNPGEEVLLPRAWDSEQKDAYMSVMGLKEGQRPTFTQNMYFMFKHQIGTMYMRYFMWNFAGRESDIQNAGWLRPADWFKKIPAALATNKGRNNFFMIPFFLGLIGMFYHFLKDTKNFVVIALLFVMLGVAIVFYLNSPPVEPRERDYIYVGSYYAFAFWIGLAVLGIADILRRIINNGKLVILAASFIGLAAPVVMIYDGWNDHDRSNRYFSVDAASNALNSCDPNGILFTGGDNDTFPLWYAQEAEGCRTDLRVLVMSYCNTDWYIDQTTRKAYQSEPFQYTLGTGEYRQGGPNDYLPFVNAKISSIDAKEYLNLIAKNYAPLRNGDHNFIPSKVLTLPVDKESVLATGIIPKLLEGFVVDHMELNLKGNVLQKRDLVFLDLLVTTNWERPIYLNHTSMSELNLDLAPYAVQEGNVYRILPVKNPRNDRAYLVDTEKSYDLILNKFRFRGLDDPKVYYSDDYKIPVFSHRSSANTLAQALIDEGNREKAARVLLYSLEKMPDAGVPYDLTAADTVSLLFQAGEKRKALEMAKVVGHRADEMATYLVAEGDRYSMELRQNIFVLGSLQESLYENGEDTLAAEFANAYEKLLADLQSTMDTKRSDF